jgi:indole-3-glycerol phosphate synthase/phosphoribosylanthranilate isomerase
VSDFIPAYQGIADAISVLTDAKYFGGHLTDLKKARALTATPLLRKDFIVDPVQIFEAYAAGADAVLLMLSVLDDETYQQCATAAAEVGLHTLTEVHDQSEMQRALALKAPIIGINNRDLRSLAIDLSVTERLAPMATSERIVISESGIRHHQDVRRLSSLVDGFLVGSSLMQSRNLACAARELAYGPIKVCGLTRKEDVQAVFASGASYGGLIFAQASPRSVSLPQALLLRQVAALNFVGVFVEQTLSEIVAITNELQLSAVQLHGDYLQHDVDFLLSRLPENVEVWSVCRVATAADLLSLPSQRHARHRVLLDYKGAQLGGNARAFDWNLLNTLHRRDHLVLAGGVDSLNIAAAKQCGVGIVDVNSGVEVSPGIKSPEKMQALFNAIRQDLVKGKNHE